MTKRRIYITAQDQLRLEHLLAEAGPGNHRDRQDLKSLEEELRRAQVVDPRKVPPNIVTMNTRLRMRDMEDDSEMEVTLVFPDAANIDDGRLSVLSPIGTAILGYPEGATITWAVPAGRRRIRIEKVLYQPEAAGDFDR